jgi:catechol 2,3-dioxygenase-like lactoylglutathione lyase family enzyme
LHSYRAAISVNETSQDRPPPGQTEIALEVSDVVAIHAELLDRGVPFEVDLQPVTGDGHRSLVAAHFRDPDGHLVSLVGWLAKE